MKNGMIGINIKCNAFTWEELTFLYPIRKTKYNCPSAKTNYHPILKLEVMLRGPFLLLLELREELPRIQEGLSPTFQFYFITLRGPSQT